MADALPSQPARLRCDLTAICFPRMARVTAQDFYDYDKCPHRVYLNRFGDPKEKLPQSDFLNLLFERALDHERDVINDLPYEMPKGSTLEEQARSTMQLMEAGVERIYHGVFLQDEASGIPGLLEKTNGKSRFGLTRVVPSASSITSSSTRFPTKKHYSSIGVGPPTRSTVQNRRAIQLRD
jgi:predicted RecB family nuclease